MSMAVTGAAAGSKRQGPDMGAGKGAGAPLEIANIKKLFMVKARNSRKGFFGFLAVAALMLISILARMISNILSAQDGGTGMVAVHTTMEFSTPFFIGLVIGYIIGAVLYRQTNDRLSVFPQTNTSRWVSSQLIAYAIALGAGLTVLEMHLIACAAVGIVSLFRENIHLGFGFEPGFIMAGFAVFVMYSFLIVAAIEFIGAVFRKWFYPAASVMTVIVIIVFTNMSDFMRYYIPKALSFLTREQSLGIFTVKALIAWVLLVAVSLLINRHTVYYKSKSPNSKRFGTIFGCTALVLIGVSTLGVELYREHKQEDVTQVQTVGVIEPEEVGDSVSGSFEEYMEAYRARQEQVRIDVSHLPRGSGIKVEANDDFLIYDAALISPGSMTEEERLNWVNPLSDLQGDTVVVTFDPPYMELNGVEILHYLNAEYSVRLEGDTLHFEFDTEKNVQVVFLPVWGIARQFEPAFGKGYFTERAFDGSSPWYYGFGGGYGYCGGGMIAYTAVE